MIGSLYLLLIVRVLPELTNVHEEEILVGLMNLKFFVQSSTPQGSLFSVNDSFDSLENELDNKNGVFPGTMAILNFTLPSGSKSA